MPAVEWRIGRQFTVRSRVHVENGTLLPGVTYTVETFGRCRSEDGIIYIFNPSSRTSTEQVMRWLDGAPVISDGLLRLINHHPESPYIRGFMRAELGIAPRRKETPTTTKEWLVFLENNKPVAPPPVPVNSRAEPIEDVVSVRIQGKIVQLGISRWSRTDRFTGTVDVPRHILARGPRRARAWIRENYYDLVGDDMQEGDEETNDVETVDTEPFELISDNISSVIGEEGIIVDLTRG